MSICLSSSSCMCLYAFYIYLYVCERDSQRVCAHVRSLMCTFRVELSKGPPTSVGNCILLSWSEGWGGSRGLYSTPLHTNTDFRGSTCRLAPDKRTSWRFINYNIPAASHAVLLVLEEPWTLSLHYHSLAAFLSNHCTTPSQ